MASPMSYQARSPEAGIQILSLQFLVGTTGAVGVIQGPGGSRMKEFRRITAANPSPVVRTGAGVYDVFLRETWLALIAGFGTCIGAVGATAGAAGKITSSITSVAVSPPKVTMTFIRIDTGVAADPQLNDVACITLILKNLRPV
jgi:phage-related minor tail protein